MKPITRWLTLMCALALALLGLFLAAGITPPAAPAAAAHLDATLQSAGNPGDLDLTFDPGDGADSWVQTLALQPDGKILIGGQFTTYNGVTRTRLARANTDGALDTTFDPGSGANSNVYALAVQPDGKILIGGPFSTYNGVARKIIARVNADGALDTTFDPGSNWTEGWVSAFALQPDGKILIGGGMTFYNGVARNRLARVNADGSLDATFDPGSGADGAVRALALQPDGKVIIGGEFTTYNGVARNRLARVNADGSLDTTFDPGSGADDRVWALALQPDGKIIIGGEFTTYNSVARSRIARLNADGSLDTTFNPGSGVVGSSVYALALQPNGKILIGGAFTTYNGVARNGIVRVNPDGSLDTTFDPGLGTNDSVFALALQPDGKFLIGGGFTLYNGIVRTRLARVYGEAEAAPTMSKTVTPATAGPSDPVAYTLRLDNPTAAPLTGIVITDTLPADILSPQVSSNVAITARPGTRYVWDVAHLAPGASAVITLTGQVNAATTQVAIVNTARFSSNGGSGAASATFTLPGVSVTRSGGGVGQVTSVPAGITCGRACSRLFAMGTPVTLTATPAAGSVFCGWSGACSGTGTCAITISGYHAVTARFGAGDCSGDVTISAVRNGDWANPATWSAGRVPTAGDIVLIGAGRTVNTPSTPVVVNKLYQQGTLQSARGSALALRVTDTLSNTGLIRGQEGAPTAGATCGAPGSDVLLSGWTLRNTGTIQGGAGRGSGCCGGDGGKVALSFGMVDNSGQVVGGAGGNVLCCPTSTPGNGGSVTILSYSNVAGLKSTGDFIGGKGGDQTPGCGTQYGGCGGDINLAARPVRIPQSLGQLPARVLGGAAGLDTNGQPGNCGGQDPVVIRCDPSDIEISNAQLAADGIVIFGGMDWTMTLTNTATGMISATQGITLAVGTGGVIDLRGSQPGAFTAPRFFIASDNVLLDAGQTLADIVDAADIIQTGAQILGAIEVSAPGYLRGARGATFAIPIELINNSPITFTYNLATSGGSGLPAAIPIGPVSSAVVTLTVTAPALGGEDMYTVTAAATASPFHSGQTVIRVYAPPETAAASLAQTFTGGVFYPFAGTLNCGGVTFAQTWTGQLDVTLGEAATTPLLLPQVYTLTTSGGTPPAATLTLCYDESAAEAADVYSDTPLALYQGGAALRSTRAADAAMVTAEAVALPGVFRIGVVEEFHLYLPLVLSSVASTPQALLPSAR